MIVHIFKDGTISRTTKNRTVPGKIAERIIDKAVELKKKERSDEKN